MSSGNSYLAQQSLHERVLFKLVVPHWRMLVHILGRYKVSAMFDATFRAKCKGHEAST